MSCSSLQVQISMQLDRFELRVDFQTSAQVTGIFGPSGAGKSSLLQAIAGLVRRARGKILLGSEVWLDSEAGAFLPPERRGVGYVPQDGLLFPHLSVRQNLLAGAGRARRNGSQGESLLNAVCELLELTPMLDRDVATLSGGERQRVALGRAICSGARLLLLDEPLASLDLPLRRRVLPFLRRVRQEFQIPMLVVSHDPIEIQALCSEVIVLREGKLTASGPAHRILSDPAVFSLAPQDGFENIVPGILVSSGPVSRVRLESTSISLFVPGSESRPGDNLLVGIPAREIIIAEAEPQGLSAQNVLPARISRVVEGGRLILVTAAVENRLELVVEVTTRACRQLGLAPGKHVFLIIKTASCMLYEASGERRAASGSGD